MELEPGQILDEKYRITRLLGRGGMGAVFAGENVRIRRQVAIKVLHAGAAGMRDALMRFEREAQAAGQIGSDHIAEVLDLGVTPTGDRYMVMEYLDGESLQARIARGRLDPMHAVPLVEQLLRGLDAAHRAGIIHRDLKPDNVFILKEKARYKDFVKILDFGISKFSALTGESAVATRAGAVMGTPYYMSPEQAKSADGVDARSDLYAVGVVLYQAVTGQVPFQAQTFAELLFKIVFDTPPLPQTIVPTLDAGLVGIIMKAMSRAPADRYQSAPEFEAALAAWKTADHSVLAAIPPPNAAAGLPLPGPSGGEDLSTIALDPSLGGPPSGSFAQSGARQGPPSGAFSQSGAMQGPPSGSFSQSGARQGPPSGSFSQSQPMLASAGAPPTGAPNTTSSWGGGATFPERAKPSNKLPAAILGVSLGVLALGGGIFLATRGRAPEASSTTQAAALPSSPTAVSAAPAAASVAPAAVAASADPTSPAAAPPAPSASLAPSSAPAAHNAAGAKSRPSAAAAAAHSAAPAPAKAGGKAVSDFGY